MGHQLVLVRKENRQAIRRPLVVIVDTGDVVATRL